jgi:hypothetical protein
MKVVTEENKSAETVTAKVAPGMTRVYNKLDGSSVDVHAVDAKEYVSKLPHLWSFEPVAKAKAKIVAEDAVIVSEPATAKEAASIPEITAVLEPAPTTEDKPISARSRKLAKFED